MDDTTEPIIAVIGHPIAGNPTQFALESGLQAAGIDCRVFSVDIDDNRIRDAVLGMHAMNFAGIWVADTSRDAIERWLAATDRGGKWVDFLRRDPNHAYDSAAPDSIWEPNVLKAQAWPKLVAQSIPTSVSRFAKIVFVDQSLADVENELTEQKRYWIQWFESMGVKALAALNEDQLSFQRKLPAADELSHHEESLSEDEALLVIVSESDQLDLTPLSQLTLPSQTVMVDLNENSDPAIIAAADHLKATSQGTFIRGVDVHAKCLSEVISRLFGQDVPLEVLQEAIDEYLAV